MARLKLVTGRKHPVARPGRKYPVPPLSRCEPTINREARYWCSRFRGQLTLNDLKQEGWAIALKVLYTFDSTRGVKIETVLTLSLRRHFSRLVKDTLTRAGVYNDEQRTLLMNAPRSLDPRASLDARLLILRLRRLPYEQQVLARELFNADGRVLRVARRYGWSFAEARRRVLALRDALRRKGT